MHHVLLAHVACSAAHAAAVCKAKLADRHVEASPILIGWIAWAWWPFQMKSREARSNITTMGQGTLKLDPTRTANLLTSHVASISKPAAKYMWTYISKEARLHGPLTRINSKPFHGFRYDPWPRVADPRIPPPVAQGLPQTWAYPQHFKRGAVNKLWWLQNYHGGLQTGARWLNPVIYSGVSRTWEPKLS